MHRIAQSTQINGVDTSKICRGRDWFSSRIDVCMDNNNGEMKKKKRKVDWKISRIVWSGVDSIRRDAKIDDLSIRPMFHDGGCDFHRHLRFSTWLTTFYQVKERNFYENQATNLTLKV